MVRWSCEQQNIEAGTSKKISFNINLENDESRDIQGELEFTLKIKESREEIEWFLGLDQKKAKPISVSPQNPEVLKVPYKLSKGEKTIIPFILETPKGGEMGDSSSVAIKQNGEFFDLFTVTIKQTIIVIKTTIGQETKIARDIGLKARTENAEYIYSILAPPDLKGYVFIETMYPDRTIALLKTVRGARNMISGEVDISELENYLISKPAVESLEIGNYVEVIEGPFKGEKARITHVDNGKDEITLELQNAIVPIPLTVKADSVKVLDKEVK
ncbi:MAG: transcription elongation factor Spt5 [Candidatus Thermoplasmatota archaeon]|jgi:transcriptional antiterminator NusG|nr:transcription elongation factor Spt5 [Candidatus Thermoplasmatota archaeon]MCL5680455.1 transcription elongation factor Spt5 [Candidatus Thermoplasmatota archaeon]